MAPLRGTSEGRNSTGERIGRLEVSVETIMSRLDHVGSLLESIQSAQAKGRETNWTVVISAALLLGGLYAAAIHPLQADIDRQEREALTLAKAVLVQTDRLTALEVDQAKQNNELRDARNDLLEIHDQGSPAIDRRIAIIEYKLNIHPERVP